MEDGVGSGVHRAGGPGGGDDGGGEDDGGPEHDLEAVDLGVGVGGGRVVSEDKIARDAGVEGEGIVNGVEIDVASEEGDLHRVFVSEGLVELLARAQQSNDQ